VHRIAHDELAAHGAVLTPVYEPLPTEFRYAYENADDWHGPLDAIVEDRARNALIVNAVTAGCAEGATALVLTGRVAHAALLTAELRDAGLRVEILVGSLKSKERASILDRARSGELQAIVATGLADEGLDVPCLSEVFLTFPAKHEGRLLQRIGRVLRPHPRKGAPRIVDFHDHRVGVLAHQARKRAHTVRKVFGERSAA
jgi:superfamily II DNA or RNA helicase